MLQIKVIAGQHFIFRLKCNGFFTLKYSLYGFTNSLLTHIVVTQLWHSKITGLVQLIVA